MPIVRSLLLGDHGDADHAIGRELAAVAWTQTAHLVTASVGIGERSCAAAVAIVTPMDYGPPIAFGGTTFKALVGHSRLLLGHDPDFNAFIAVNQDLYRHQRVASARAASRFNSNSALNEHAEQTAILLATSLPNVNFWQHMGMCYLYVDYEPCPSCQRWFQQRPENWVVLYGAAGPQKEKIMGGLKIDMNKQIKDPHSRLYNQFTRT